MCRPRCLLAPATLAGLLAAVAHADPVAYATRVADGNLMGVTLGNFGFIGNNFVTRSPSLEYPLGTGYEHLPHGGLWIGAQAFDDIGAFVGVTSACLDMNQGTSTPSATEFTPASGSIRVRSTLPSSAFYDPDAVSEQDLIAPFDDLTPKQAANNPESHRPLRVRVRQESYAWSFAPYSDMLFLRYTITNAGPPLANAWVGFYTEFASGPKNSYSTWPPSSGGSPLGSWYAKKWLQYDASLRLIREHRCSGYPIPSGCQLQVTPYWIGLKLLTPPGGAQGVTLAAWNWSPSNPARDQDTERYDIMSAGTIDPLNTPDVMPVTGDPVELLALGPFSLIGSSDSIHVDFALVGGAEVADIQRNAEEAQRVYNLGYHDFYTAAVVSLVEARVAGGRVRLTWQAPRGSDLDALVQRGGEGAAWIDLGTVRPDGEGYLRFEDRDVTPGRHAYRLVADGHALGEAWVEVPTGPAFALIGARNPVTTGGLEVEFSLASGAPARLDLMDVTGRVLERRDVGGMGPGSHRIALRLATRAAPGVYFLRLEQRGLRAASRFAIVP